MTRNGDPFAWECSRVATPCSMKRQSPPPFSQALTTQALTGYWICGCLANDVHESNKRMNSPAWRWEAVLTKVAVVICIGVLAVCGMSLGASGRDLRVSAPVMCESSAASSRTIGFLTLGSTGTGGPAIHDVILRVPKGNPAMSRDLVAGTVFRAGGAVNAQMSSNGAFSAGTDSVPEPMSLALFGAALLTIAMLLRGRPAEKRTKSREHVRTSNPPVPVERS